MLELFQFPPNLGLFVCSVWPGCMARGTALPVITDLITYYLFYNLFFKTKTTTIICLKEFSFYYFFSENETADRSRIVLRSKCPNYKVCRSLHKFASALGLFNSKGLPHSRSNIENNCIYACKSIHSKNISEFTPTFLQIIRLFFYQDEISKYLLFPGK